MRIGRSKSEAFQMLTGKGTTMTSRVKTTVFFAVLGTALQLCGRSAEPLRLIATIAMPNVKVRLDHLYVDAKSQRLFVAGLENGSVEVVDLKSGKWTSTIPGFKKPQGIDLGRELKML